VERDPYGLTHNLDFKKKSLGKKWLIVLKKTFTSNTEIFIQTNTETNFVRLLDQSFKPHIYTIFFINE